MFVCLKVSVYYSHVCMFKGKYLLRRLCLIRSRYCLAFSINWVHPRMFGRVHVAHPLYVLCCVVFFFFGFVCLRRVSCVLNVASVSGFPILDGPFGFYRGQVCMDNYMIFFKLNVVKIYNFSKL